MTSRRGPRAPADEVLAEQADAVLAASRALVGIAAASIAGIEDVVTLTQFRVLVMLYTRGPLNLAALAAGLDVNPSNASRTCDKLIKAGLLDRRESTSDRRHITLTVTAAGRRLVENVSRRRRSALLRVLRKMTVADREALAGSLAKFAAAAGETSGTDTVMLVWSPTA